MASRLKEIFSSPLALSSLVMLFCTSEMNPFLGTPLILSVNLPPDSSMAPLWIAALQMLLRGCYCPMP